MHGPADINYSVFSEVSSKLQSTKEAKPFLLFVLTPSFHVIKTGTCASPIWNMIGQSLVIYAHGSDDTQICIKLSTYNLGWNVSCGKKSVQKGVQGSHLTWIYGGANYHRTEVQVIE